MSMKKLLVLCIMLCPIIGISQPSKPALLNEINKDMWKPFLEGIKHDKPELYLNIHSKDFYWVATGKDSRIMNYKEYDIDSQGIMQKRSQDGATSELEVRFLDRTINNEFATEKCVMKFTFRKPNQPPQVGYGVSYVFSRKENGVWKMLVQHANAEKGSVEIFNQAAAMEEVDKI